MKPTLSAASAPARIFRGAHRLATALALLATALALHAQSTPPVDPEVAAFASFDIGTLPVSPPTDIPGGADQASLTQAAWFAWQQFILLNWPAVTQTGAPMTRGVLDPNARFGDQSRPLVWHTFRSKVEVFSNTPPGTTYNPTTQGLNFNFDAAPAYPYQVAVQPGVPPPAPPAPPPPTAWINLDETTQIALNQLFAGSTPRHYPGRDPKNPTHSSQPQQFRYLAKVNRTYFDYVATSGFFNHGTHPSNPNNPNDPNNGLSFNQYLNNYTNAISQNRQPGPDNPVIALPVGTIMVKSAWRLLGPGDDPQRYHTTTVRFYEKNSNGQLVYFQEENWGMVALHIVIKTPTAPAFIFATFEQSDNLRLLDGAFLENTDGGIRPGTRPSPATQPEYQHTDSPTGTTTTVVGSFITPSTDDKRLFLRELAPSLPKPTSGPGAIAINRRFEDIPLDIIFVNYAAHQAIANYEKNHQVTGSPWGFYKLVNVQARPLNPADKTAQPATYFQANSVVETDFTLGQFSGILIQTGAENGQTSNYSAGQPAFNVHLPTPGGPGYSRFNSGGCMGCHGNAQAAGTDFSFTLSEGPVLAPDVPVPEAHSIQGFIGRYGLSAAPTQK